MIRTALRLAGIAAALAPALLIISGCGSGGSHDGAASGALPAIPDGYSLARNPSADLRTALSLAARKHREVLIDFGADWCPDCRALDRMFRSPQVEPILRSHYVVVPVDVGQFNRNLNVAAQYINLQTSGIPALVVLSSDGAKRVATNDGSFSNARYMTPDQVRAFLTRWAPASGQ